MHRTFRKLLENAVGKSDLIIAANIDIRGFSVFSRIVESPDTAIFVKKVYIKLIDNYFPNASFFKPTGDGLLITIPYSERTLHQTVRETISSCLKILKEFSTFCANDPMINFEVPKMIGIGLSRGTSCRLVSKNKILDYSGRVLNLASRLMDFARPAGIVFDADFGIELLSDSQLKLFARDSIYIKGIAPRDPIDIWYTKDLTVISAFSRQPLEKIPWKIHNDALTLREIKKRGPNFWYNLTTVPMDPSEIKIKITYPSILRGRKQKGFISFFFLSNFKYLLEAGKPKIIMQFDALAKQLESRGVKEGWLNNIDIMYPAE